MPLSPEEKAETIWYVEFRTFAPWDNAHTPLMYLPVQKTNVRCETEADAKAEIATWVPDNYRIDFLLIERAPEWLQ